MSSYRQGLLYATGSILLWGAFPIFYKQLEHIPMADVIGHRMIWAMAFMLAVVLVLGRIGEVRKILSQPRQILVLSFTSALLGLSWGTYVWAVLNAYIVEASLGYYLTPILSVAIGVLFFREAMRPLQVLAVALAAAGVVAQVIINGIVPWVGLFLGGIFALYSAVRKTLDTAPFTGSFFETLVLFPIGVGIVWLSGSSSTAPTVNFDLLLLIASGVITILPLTWYICAAQLMPLVTLGTLFYLAPTLGFLTGVFIYDEPFSAGHAVMFSLILSGLAVFTLDAYRHDRTTPTADKIDQTQDPTRYKRL